MQTSTEELGAAFASLRQRLQGYLRRRLPDPALADDLLQNVFLKALVSQQAGKPISNLTGWLFAATRTTLVDHYRAADKPTQELDEAMPCADEDELRLHQELATCLRPFAEQLSPLYRDTLIAIDFHSEPMRALAAQQGVSVSAIKSRAARARVMLKEKLLACCQVEVAGGVVRDYYRLRRPQCAESCDGKPQA